MLGRRVLVRRVYHKERRKDRLNRYRERQTGPHRLSPRLAPQACLGQTARTGPPFRLENHRHARPPRTCSTGLSQRATERSIEPLPGTANWSPPSITSPRAAGVLGTDGPNRPAFPTREPSTCSAAAYLFDGSITKSDGKID